jgi:hypothetical protein
MDRALVNPAVLFNNPGEIVDHPNLSLATKRELLHRWAFDAYCIETRATNAPRQDEPSRLDEVIDALIAVEEAALISESESQHHGSRETPTVGAAHAA